MATDKLSTLVLVVLLACKTMTVRSFLIETFDNKMHVFAKGLTVDPDQSNRTVVNVTTLCECRTHAWSWQPVVSWSYNPTAHECILSGGPLASSSTGAAVESTLSYLYTYTTPTARIKQQVDGMYYFYSLTPTLQFSDAKAHCESFPGFHLPIIITSEQYQLLVFDIYALSGPYWLDLYGTDANDLVWGNGLSFNTTRDNTGQAVLMNDVGTFAFDVFRNKMQDAATTIMLKVVCQGNLDALPWQ